MVSGPVPAKRRRAGIEAKRVADVEAVRVLRAEGGTLTANQHRLLKKNAAIRTARAAERTAEIEAKRLEERREAQDREERWRTRQAEEQRAAQQREAEWRAVQAHVAAARAAEQKTRMVAGAVVAYRIAEHIADEAACKVVDAERGDHRGSWLGNAAKCERNATLRP